MAAQGIQADIKGLSYIQLLKNKLLQKQERLTTCFGLRHVTAMFTSAVTVSGVINLTSNR